MLSWPTRRQCALIAIMAQIGSYVPAAAARLRALDGVYTRMVSWTFDGHVPGLPGGLPAVQQVARGWAHCGGVSLLQQWSPAAACC